MIERIIFSPEADEDVRAAYQWYERRELALGEEFLRSLEAGLSTVQRHPLLFPVLMDNFRRALIRRFPYEIFYEPAKAGITVYAVFHCSQNPRKWRARLRLEA